MSTHPAIGIDLGTTYSLVAVTDPDGRPRVLPNAHGELLTPSVVCFRDGKPVVGADAKSELELGTPGVAAFFKRQMGATDVRFPANGRTYTPIELSALVLAQLKADAEAALGHPVTDAVVTVPAYFRNPEREATREAGRLAGLNVRQLVNEPTAAAMAFGFTQADGPPRTLLVYDLGGGTFDVTLLHITATETRVLTSSGDHELGGKDWDTRIVKFLGARFATQFGTDPLKDAASLGDLLHRAEQAKKQLSSAQTVPVSIAHDGDAGTYDLSREKFEELTRDLLDRTLSLVKTVLVGQSLTRTQVDGVLLVGGSTRMPMVRAAIEHSFGKPPLTGVHPDQAVALGAALCAAAQPGPGARTFGGSSTGPLTIGRRTVTDVTTHSLGMIAVNPDNTAYVNSIILSKDQPIPCRDVRPYLHRTGAAGEDFLEIYMTQGEVESPKDVVYLGRYVLHGLPKSAASGLTIEVQYAYDASGTVKVLGRVKGQTDPLPLRIEPLPADVPDRFLRPPPKPVIPHVTVYLAIDVSGSMSGRPLEEAKKAAHGFARQLDLSHCSIGVMSVADESVVNLRASQNTRAITRSIDELAVAGPLKCGNGAHPFDDARQLLAKLTGPRFVVVLADGVWDHQPVAIRAAKACHEAGIHTIAIGFGAADGRFLKQIASHDSAAVMTSMKDLVQTFTGIAQVITQSHGGSAGAKGSGGGLWDLFHRG